MTSRRIPRWLPLIAVLSVAGCSLLQGASDPLPTFVAPATVPPTKEAAIVAPQPTETMEPTLTPLPEPTLEPTAEPVPDPTVTPEPVEELPSLPAVIQYNLGDATIIQDWFPEEFQIRGMPAREMPVRLNGIISVPTAGEGPFPIVLVLHGTHPGCPTGEDGSVDFWPCDPEVEQPNYRGFDYLVQRLAAEGYVGLSININAVNTFGYGEANGEDQVGARLVQLMDHHLLALATASNGGENNFGVDLNGLVDVRRLVLVGHSRGGEMANWVARARGLNTETAVATRGYGPVYGLLMLAPSPVNFPLGAAGVPLAVVLPSCDGDVINQDGQIFYDQVRIDPDASEWATAAWLEAANHNQFNTILGPDPFASQERQDCESLLSADEQQQFTGDYALDFLETVLSQNPQAILEARGRLGLDVTAPAPDELYGLPARIQSHAPAEDRLTIWRPVSESELAINLAGGTASADGITTTFCPDGYFSAADIPGTEPCFRRDLTLPGNFAHAVISWDEPGGVFRLELPESAGDLSRLRAVSLRAVLNPLSPLNPLDTPQAFSVRLTDAAGNTAAVATPADKPALQYPVGQIQESFLGQGERFTGRVVPSTVRFDLANFTGVDLSAVREVALVFDQTESGNLFVSDLEFVRPPHIIGAYSSLLENADGANGSLRGIARLNGSSTCTGTFILTSQDRDAWAYLITNGHCAMEWDANKVITDEPVEGWNATFDYFVDTTEQPITVPVARLAYSTMKSRDVAVLELNASVGELVDKGIRPFQIAESIPDGSFDLSVIGAPATGIPPQIAYLREERCLASGRADLFEFIWHFDDTIRTSCQDIYGGSSGSPVFITDAFERGDRSIIGLINTTNLGALTPCYLGAPCEEGTGGTVFRPNTSYVTPVIGLDACFNAAGYFDLATEGCPLDDGRQLLVTGTPVQGTQPLLTAQDGTQSPATWNATLSGDLPYYRYKTGRAGEVDCRIDEGYGPPIAMANLNRIDEPLPAEEGSYLLCVLAGESPMVDETWQIPERASVARALVDTTPPTVQPNLSIMPDNMGGFRVEPIFALAELVNFRLKAGPDTETDCAVEDGYGTYRRFPITIPADQIPARLCIIGSDHAGNEGLPFDVVLGQP
jgi:hypothetical protein